MTGPPIDERRAYAPRHPAEEAIVPLLARAIGERLARLAPGPAGDEVLDVGCGGQPLRADLEAAGWRYRGMDPRPLPGVPLDVEGAIDDGELLARHPDLRDRFGLVLCTEVLEHVVDWTTAFAALHAVLAPGGHLLVTCPHVYVLHEEPFDFWRPTDHAVRAFAERSGLEVVELGRHGDPADVLFTVLQSLVVSAAGRGRASIRAAQVASAVAGRLARLLHPGGRLRRHVRFHGPTYLSTVAVLRRPA